MNEAFIIDAVRTPRGEGKARGALNSVTPLELATVVLRAIACRNHLDTSLVDDVVLGCVTPVNEQGSDIARIATLAAGYDQRVTGLQVNRFCASGLESVNIAAAKVMSGQSDIVIAGGVESMSRVPMSSDGGAMTGDPYVVYRNYFTPQGIAADLICTLWSYGREDVDSFAVESHRRAAAAWLDGRFSGSVVPVVSDAGLLILDHDEHVRADTSLDGLARLKPAFAALGDSGFDTIALQRYPAIERIEHHHHAGNSSGIVDGAAAVLIANAEGVRKLGLKPRARIRSFATVGSEPTIMLTAPAPSVEKAAKIAGMNIGDIDLHEVNEAFASVVLRYMDLLDVPHDIVNVNGGAIALGHPLGASGSILLGTVLDELERRDLSVGACTLCAAAGMGIATIIERV
ncbi:MAG: acetyl-CoA C-acetyltransferase [Sphingomonadales bacterium]|nr:acetyl-CoA C-acetyltransferase [Sphingomonadales bacterium]